MWGYFAFSQLLGMEMEDPRTLSLVPFIPGPAQIHSSHAQVLRKRYREDGGEGRLIAAWERWAAVKPERP